MADLSASKQDALFDDLYRRYASDAVLAPVSTRPSPSSASSPSSSAPSPISASKSHSRRKVQRKSGRLKKSTVKMSQTFSSLPSTSQTASSLSKYTAEDIIKIIKIQRAYRRYIMQNRMRSLVTGYLLSEQASSLRRRTYALKEIISTEETYVTNLKLLINSYINPLMVQGILSPSEVEGIFCNITHICSVNTEFLSALQAQMQKWPAVTEFGTIFSRITQMMPFYSLYMRRYEQSSN